MKSIKEVLAAEGKTDLLLTSSSAAQAARDPATAPKPQDVTVRQHLPEAVREAQAPAGPSPLPERGPSPLPEPKERSARKARVLQQPPAQSAPLQQPPASGAVTDAVSGAQDPARRQRTSKKILPPLAPAPETLPPQQSKPRSANPSRVNFFKSLFGG